MNKNEHAAAAVPRPHEGRVVPTSEEAGEWLKKHLANAPERDEQWYREVLAIYRAGKREAVADTRKAS